MRILKKAEQKNFICSFDFDSESLEKANILYRYIFNTGKEYSMNKIRSPSH